MRLLEDLRGNLLIPHEDRLPPHHVVLRSREGATLIIHHRTREPLLKADFGLFALVTKEEDVVLCDLKVEWLVGG
jgi:hypothetical protein